MNKIGRKYLVFSPIVIFEVSTRFPPYPGTMQHDNHGSNQFLSLSSAPRVKFIATVSN